VVVILLGLLSGHARLLHEVLVAAPGDGTKGGLLHREPEEPWPDFVAGLAPRDGRNDVIGDVPEADRAGWTRLADGLAEVTGRVTVANLEPFQLWAPRVARFSFLLSPYAENER
jgi:hypothetical protein